MPADIQEKFKQLTTRQALDARTAALRFGNKLMTRMACFALGLEEDPETGLKVEPMDAKQLKAAEIVLKKILPDQAAIQEIPKDDFADMSRTEMLELLGTLVSASPQLLQNPEIREAVNKSQTIVDISAGRKVNGK